MSLNDPFKVLVSAILSTRTRDEQTAKAVQKLFSVVKKPEDLLKLSEDEIDELIKPVGFHRIKAKNLKELARILIDEYDSKVPNDLNDLLKLPGVGKKVANIVLSFLGKPAIAVDTHVHRIANRIGVVKTKKPDETEEELKKIVPKELWSRLNKAFVGFGQVVCKPIKPLCEDCPFKSFCEYFKNKSEE
jgi:endonuclease-3